MQSSGIEKSERVESLKNLGSMLLTAPNDFFSLEDVCAQKWDSIERKDVNLLFCVREVS